MAIEYLERNEEDNTTDAQQNKIQYIERDQYDGPQMDGSVLNKPQNDFNWLSWDDWGKAAEGAKYAFMGDENGNIDISNIPKNFAKGVGNLASGAAAGVNDFLGDATNTLIPDIANGDSVEEWFDEGADWWRDQQSKNSVMGAMGEELGYGAGMGPAVSKAVKYGGKGLGYLSGIPKKMTLTKGRKYGHEIEERAKKAGEDAKKAFYDRNIKSRAITPQSKYPGIDAQNIIKAVTEMDTRGNVARDIARQDLLDAEMPGGLGYISRIFDAVSPGKRRYGTIDSILDKVIGSVPGAKYVPFGVGDASKAAAKRLYDKGMSKYGIEKGFARYGEDGAEHWGMGKRDVINPLKEVKPYYNDAIKNIPRDNANAVKSAFEAPLYKNAPKWLDRTNATVGTGFFVDSIDAALQRALDNQEEQNITNILMKGGK